MPTNRWTFPAILARSFALLREYPSLIVPVLIADLLSFAAMHVQHALHQPLFELILGGHQSVLSTTHQSFQLNPQNATKAFLVTFPLLWGCYYLSVCFYAAAMLSISKLLQDKQSGADVQPHRILESVISRRRDLLLFSLLFLGLLVVGAVASYLLFTLAGDIPSLARKMSFEMGLLIELIVAIPVACFGTVPALSLLTSNVSLLDKRSVNLARLCGFTAVAAQETIVLLIRQFAPDAFYQQTSILALLLREASESLVGAMPFVLLFVALALLTSEQPITSSSSDN